MSASITTLDVCVCVCLGGGQGMRVYVPWCEWWRWRTRNITKKGINSGCWATFSAAAEQQMARRVPPPPRPTHHFHATFSCEFSINIHKSLKIFFTNTLPLRERFIRIPGFLVISSYR